MRILHILPNPRPFQTTIEQRVSHFPQDLGSHRNSNKDYAYRTPTIGNNTFRGFSWQQAADRASMADEDNILISTAVVCRTTMAVARRQRGIMLRSKEGNTSVELICPQLVKGNKV